MQRSVRNRGMGRVGACLAFASSILVLAALPSPAAAYEDRQAPQERQAPRPGSAHFTVQLTPEEVPTGGNDGGSGVARLDFDETRGTACYVVEWKGLEGDVTAGHLHEGPRGDPNGPHAIDFFNDQHFAGTQGRTEDCVTSTRDKIRDVLANPTGYYVNIHTTAFKPGAIRGQLGSAQD